MSQPRKAVETQGKGSGTHEAKAVETQCKRQVSHLVLSSRSATVNGVFPAIDRDET